MQIPSIGAHALHNLPTYHQHIETDLPENGHQDIFSARLASRRCWVLRFVLRSRVR